MLLRMKRLKMKKWRKIWPILFCSTRIIRRKARLSFWRKCFTGKWTPAFWFCLTRMTIADPPWPLHSAQQDLISSPLANTALSCAAASTTICKLSSRILHSAGSYRRAPVCLLGTSHKGTDVWQGSQGQTSQQSHTWVKGREQGREGGTGLPSIRLTQRKGYVV